MIKSLLRGVLFACVHDLKLDRRFYTYPWWFTPLQLLDESDQVSKLRDNPWMIEDDEKYGNELHK
jgi:hypothetical protein